MATVTYASNSPDLPGYIAALSAASASDEAGQLFGNFINQYLSSAPSVSVSQFTGPNGSLQNGGATPFDVVLPGSNLVVDATVPQDYLVEGNSSVDFSDSDPVPLNIVVGGGSNSIFLNSGASLVQSTDGNDTITSDGGQDTIIGGSGSDSLVGGGQSFVQGGSGSDTLIGGATSAARDTLEGGSGSTVIKVSHGNNSIIGGTGPETITAGSGKDTVVAGPGPETIYGGVRTDITGGGHSLIYSGDQDSVSLRGSDTLVGGVNPATITTNPNSQASIVGGAGALDVTLANSGASNDTIFGGSGGITVHVQETFSQVLSDNTKDASGNTIIKFTNGQQVHVSNATVDFKTTAGTDSVKF